MVVVGSVVRQFREGITLWQIASEGFVIDLPDPATLALNVVYLFQLGPQESCVKLWKLSHYFEKSTHNAKALAPCGAVWSRVVWRVAHKMWGVTCGGFFLVSGVAHVALWHTFGKSEGGGKAL